MARAGPGGGALSASTATAGGSRPRRRATSWRGMPRAELEAEAQRFASERGRALLRPDALRAWRRWQGDGARLVIVTASPEIIVAPFARALGADRLIGTRLAFDAAGPRHRRASTGANCRGPEKVRRLQRGVRRRRRAGGGLWRHRRRPRDAGAGRGAGPEGLQRHGGRAAMRHAERRGPGPDRAAAGAHPRRRRRRAEGEEARLLLPEVDGLPALPRGPEGHVRRHRGRSHPGRRPGRRGARCWPASPPSRRGPEPHGRAARLPRSRHPHRRRRRRGAAEPSRGAQRASRTR